MWKYIKNQAEISLNTLFPCQPRLALPVSLGAWPCSCSELMLPPHTTACSWLLGPRAGEGEAAGGEGGKSHPRTCKPSSMAPCTCPDGTCLTWPCSAPWWQVGTGE